MQETFEDKERRIELWVERQMDRLDHAFLTREDLTQEQYERQVKVINNKAKQMYETDRLSFI